jgi:hypothetical protein
MVPDFEIPFDRVTWRDGQRLASRDMNDSVSRETRLRWLHNRFIHGAAFGNWGIVDGFRVQLATSGRLVGVYPGYAVDILGRDLVLSVNVAVDVPDVSGPTSLVLAARYRGDAAYRARHSQRDECTGTPFSSGGERPAFVWLPLEDVEPGIDLPLAGAHVTTGIAQAPLAPVQRYMRAMTRPRIAFGTTRAFQTGWHDIKLGGVPEEWVQTFVNTSAAGFVRTPRYFARLARPGQAAMLIEATGGIQNPEREAFSLRVFNVVRPPGFGPTADDAEAQGWTVSWWGVEPEDEPPSNLPAWIHLSGYVLLHPTILFP